MKFNSSMIPIINTLNAKKYTFNFKINTFGDTASLKKSDTILDENVENNGLRRVNTLILIEYFKHLSKPCACKIK